MPEARLQRTRDANPELGGHQHHFRPEYSPILRETVAICDCGRNGGIVNTTEDVWRLADGTVISRPFPSAFADALLSRVDWDR